MKFTILSVLVFICAFAYGHEYQEDQGSEVLLQDNKDSEALEDPRKPDDCWKPCKRKGGKCGFCGKYGACCRKGWNDPKVCDNKRANVGYHACQKIKNTQHLRKAKKGHLKGKLADCWGPCKKKGGFCKFCGCGGACCRKGWKNDPKECDNSIANKGYHACQYKESVTPLLHG